MYESGVLGKGERDGLTRANEILNRERLAESGAFQPTPGAESLAENFFDLRKKPWLLFQPLLLFACFGALCDAPLMCVHFLQRPSQILRLARFLQVEQITVGRINVTGSVRLKNRTYSRPFFSKD
jgi:hypothetical protein